MKSILTNLAHPSQVSAHSGALQRAPAGERWDEEDDHVPDGGPTGPAAQAQTDHQGEHRPGDTAHTAPGWGRQREYKYIHGLVQDCSISSTLVIEILHALAMEILQSCTKPSI